MPDAWELDFGLDPEEPADAQGDLDGDGSANVSECWLGTDPRSAESLLGLQLTRWAGVEDWISFRAAAGVAYTLEMSDSGATTGWSVLYELEPAYVATEVEITQPSSGGKQRFYRLRVNR